MWSLGFIDVDRGFKKGKRLFLENKRLRVRIKSMKRREKEKAKAPKCPRRGPGDRWIAINDRPGSGLRNSAGLAVKTNE